MDIVSILISMLSGAFGGHAVANASPEQDLGPMGNILAGVVGGTAAGYIVQAMNLFAATTAATGAAAAGAEPVHHVNIAEILATIASSGIGGALLTYIVAMVKNSSNKA